MNIVYLDIEAEPRYWEDASVNGVEEDNEAPTIPGSDGNLWKVRINLVTGHVIDWPADVTAKIHYKVCDQGEYWLCDETGERVLKAKGYYVPDVLNFSESGHGDYIIMNIDKNGAIQGFTTPYIDMERWSEI